MKDTITLQELRQTELYRKEQTRHLRELLEPKTPTNEPVAWLINGKLFEEYFRTSELDKIIPLYTHPASLTDEEIDSVIHELRQKSFDPERWVDVYTIAIETIIQLRDELAILRKAQEKC